MPTARRAAWQTCSLDGPRDPQTVRRQYERELAVLRDLAERNLGYAESEGDFVYGLQALLSFEDAGAWQRNLHAIADGELQLQCPTCADDLLPHRRPDPVPPRPHHLPDLPPPVRHPTGPDRSVLTPVDLELFEG